VFSKILDPTTSILKCNTYTMKVLLFLYRYFVFGCVIYFMLLMNHEFHENFNFKNNNTFIVYVLHFNMEVVGSSILLNTSIYYWNSQTNEVSLKPRKLASMNINTSIVFILMHKTIDYQYS
jgi:hypothetical protein